MKPPKRKLNFHPIGEMFSDSKLSASFLSKTEYKRIVDEMMVQFQELSIAVDILSSGNVDARARAYAVSVGNDRFCEDNGIQLSVVELTAELVKQTLHRLVFVRSIDGAVFKDQVFAYKAPKMYADLSPQVLDFVKGLNLFSHIQTLGKSSKFPAKDLNSDIKSLCDTALSKCLFILNEISTAKWSATRSNVIAKMIADNKS